MKRSTKMVLAAASSAALIAGCSPEAETVDHNVTTAADNFEVNRRIVFINGNTDTYLFEVEGRCSITDEGNQLEVLCKTSEGDDPDAYVKHMFGISSDTTYLVIQLDELNVDPWHHEIRIRPETLIPDVNFATSGN